MAPPSIRRFLTRAGSLLTCLLVVLAACSPRVEVQSERSRIATFSRYRTYVWVSSAVAARTTAEVEASLLDWRIRNSVDRALAAKGYVRTEGSASLLVDYDVVTRERNTDTFREFFRNRIEEPFAQGSTEGTLALQLVDARTHEMAYRASATGVIDEHVDRRRLEAAVDRMLADLPHVMEKGGTR